MNNKTLNISLSIIYFMVALAYSYAKAIYHELSMYILISLLVFTAFVFYKINTVKLNLSFSMALGLVFIADIFHVMTDFNALIYGTTFFFLFNSVLFLLVLKYAFNISFKNGALLYTPILISILLFQIISLNQNVLSNVSVSIFYCQLLFLLVLAYRYYSKTIYKSSFFILLGVLFLTMCYVFGALNKLIIQNPYYSFVDSLSFATGIYFFTKGVVVEDYYFAKNKKKLQLSS